MGGFRTNMIFEALQIGIGLGIMVVLLAIYWEVMGIREDTKK